MNSKKLLNKIVDRRKKRVRAKIFGTAERPRLSIFRSNSYIYAQLIDDDKGKTLFSSSSREIQKSGSTKAKKDQAALVGKLIAEKALGFGIKKAVFDRGAYKYHGRVRALAESARGAGLKV